MKLIIIKLTLFIIVISICNLIYNEYFYENDVKKFSPCAYQCLNLNENIDLLYFGESSNNTFDITDSSKKSISEFIEQLRPNLKIVTIDTPAVHSGIYKYWVKACQKNLPKAILVTMNLRSFDQMWINSKLETSLIRSVRLLNAGPNLFNRFLLSLNNFQDKTDEERENHVLKNWKKETIMLPFKFKYKTVREWDDGMANGGWMNADGTWNMPKISLATHYIKAYAFNIKEDNPRVKDFDDIVEWGKENHVSVYFNILSENILAADTLVGKELVFLMRNNSAWLKDRYSRKGVVVIDNLESVKSNEFIDKNWTTEHYTCQGRLRIAKKIIEKINI